jgi:hypothetical protein
MGRIVLIFVVLASAVVVRRTRSSRGTLGLGQRTDYRVAAGRVTSS